MKNNEEVEKDNMKSQENKSTTLDRKLTFYESLKLGPLEKFSLHGIFPWRLTISILLVIFTIIQCVSIVGRITEYQRAQIRGLYSLFLVDEDKTSTDYFKVNYLFTLDSLREQVSNSVNNFFNIDDHSINLKPYDLFNPVAEFSYIDNSEKEMNIKKKFFYALNKDNLGPFEYDDKKLKLFLNDVVEFKINFTFIGEYPFTYEDNFECDKWSVIQKYSFSSRAHFVVTLDISTSICDNIKSSLSFLENFFNKLLWVHLVVIILAMISLYHTMHFMHTLLKMYMKAKLKLKRKADSMPTNLTSDESMYFNPLFESFSDEEPLEMNYTKLKEEPSLIKEKKTKNPKPKKHFQFLQFWSIFIITGNILQICGSSLALSHENEVTTIITVLIGSGCLFACLGIGKYIEKHPNYSTIYGTLKKSFPVVIRYLIGAFPIYLGFLFLGLAAFWRSERFTDSVNASIALFSLIQGDVIWDIFSDLSRVGFYLGQIYAYSFSIIFMVIVWNIFISIIEDSYVVTQIKNKTSLIFKVFSLDPKYVDIKLHSKPSLEVTKKYFQKMDKVSEILKKKFSKSLKSHELLKNKNREQDFVGSGLSNKSNSILYINHPLSLNKNLKENKHKDIKSTIQIPESILENEEYELMLGRRKSSLDRPRKNSMSFNKKKIEEVFDRIENRFDNILDISEKVNQKINILKQSEMSSKEDIYNGGDITIIKNILINRINLIENKSKDCREVWMRRI